MKVMLVRELGALPDVVETTVKETGLKQQLLGLVVTASESGKEAEMFTLLLRPEAAEALLPTLQAGLQRARSTGTGKSVH